MVSDAAVMFRTHRIHVGVVVAIRLLHCERYRQRDALRRENGDGGDYWIGTRGSERYREGGGREGGGREEGRSGEMERYM